MVFDKKVWQRDYMRMRYRTDPIHREKQKIRVRTAKLKGRPRTCSKCGSNERVEGHHPDFKEPNLRVFLCRACHRAEHPGLI